MKTEKHLAISEYAVVDLETTGLEEHDRPCEIGIVLLDSGLNILETYQRVINPGIQVGITENMHGLSDETLAMEKSFKEIHPEISSRLQGNILVAHKLEFEERMLRNAYDDFIPNFFDHGYGICTKKSTDYSTLREASKNHSIPYPKHLQHSALDDALVCAQLLKKIYSYELRKNTTPMHLELISPDY